MTFPRKRGSSQKLTASMASGSAGEMMNLTRVSVNPVSWLMSMRMRAR